MLREPPVSQYSRSRIGLGILELGEWLDPDNDEVPEVVIKEKGENTTLSEGDAEKDDDGKYSFIIGQGVTEALGDYEATWTYTLEGFDRVAITGFEVVRPMLYFEMLRDFEKQIVFDVYHHVGNMFDSVNGGPYLWEVIQSDFNPFEDIARIMMNEGVSYINFTHAPPMNPPFVVGIGSTSGSFPEDMGAVLEKATYVEFLNHLGRSYLEQPEKVNINIPREDRTKYRDMYRQEADREQKTLDQWVKLFKRKYLVGTRRALLVAGGNYPRSFMNPARPHWMYSMSRGF